jgi:hypothetical protein
LREGCASANKLYSRAELVFILEHYFASKSFSADREAFSNAYADKEVPNKTPTGNKILGGCLSLRRWWTFSASAIKGVLEVLPYNEESEKQLVCLVILMSPKLINTVAVTIAF